MNLVPKPHRLGTRITMAKKAVSGNLLEPIRKPGWRPSKRGKSQRFFSPSRGFSDRLLGRSGASDVVMVLPPGILKQDPSQGIVRTTHNRDNSRATIPA